MQKRYKRKNNYRMVRTSDFNCRQGGVALAAKTQIPLMAAGVQDGRCPARQAYEESRYIRGAVSPAGCKGNMLHLASLYCHAGASVMQRIANERLIFQILEDMAQVGSQPAIISIDINMPRSRSLEEAIDLGWIDLGAALCVDKPLMTYSKGKQLEKITRPHRLMANKEAMDIIEDFKVVTDSGVPSHAILHFAPQRRDLGVSE